MQTRDRNPRIDNFRIQTFPVRAKTFPIDTESQKKTEKRENSNDCRFRGFASLRRLFFGTYVCLAHPSTFMLQYSETNSAPIQYYK